MYDICMKGFVDGYYNWTAHGEAQVLENYDDQPAPVCLETPVAPGMRKQRGGYEQMNWDQRMVYDTVGPQFFSTHQEPEAEGASSSFPAGASSYDYNVSGLVQAVDQPLYSGCDQSQLAAVARLVNIKAEHMSERCYDQVSQWASDLLPRDHTLPSSYYNTKKMIRDVGLPVEKIHTCRNGCMLYWKNDIDMEYCKFCGDPRYKPTRGRNPRRKKSPYAVLRYLPLTPRLQRLYASPATVEHMTWHASHVTEADSMCHPSDAEAWRHFDRTHPNFALEPCNIGLGLCIDGFAPHG
ncbi:UNVERIFIED_CONTAM: hypothetical protein Scaly_2792800 [Sesamum calycinum]|uniref:Uncharacterized protein n=1 Tax=Sesamum calycinum TaxID=2727403 RepID=A0AAW2IW90_9LAMI